MLNLSFVPKPREKGLSSGFKRYERVVDSSGRSVLVLSENSPYDGMSADSFKLSAQLEAGVPLQHVSPPLFNGISSIDKNNASALDFVNSLKNQTKQSK